MDRLGLERYREKRGSSDETLEEELKKIVSILRLGSLADFKAE
ncbi:MAG TPA: hypothetical protein VD736_09520 [Nitrososphaera sp.]|nr:hypothetical protein [Nitrososphaera sp.]